MRMLGLTNPFDFASTERPVCKTKLDTKIDVSMISDESYEPIHSGPWPRVSKPHVVPLLDLELMNRNLEIKNRRQSKQKKGQKIKYRNSNPSRKSSNQNWESSVKNNIEQINHNKYGINDRNNKNQNNISRKRLDFNSKEYSEDEESSLWSCSYCLRKAQEKGGIRELFALANCDFEESMSHSVHSSILFSNQTEYLINFPILYS